MTRIIKSAIRVCLYPFNRATIPVRTTASQKGGTEMEAAVKTNDIRLLLGAINEGKKGRIVLKTGSTRLYFDFTYNGRRVEKTTGYLVTAANIVRARAELDQIMEEMANGSFNYSARFTSASVVDKTYHAQCEIRHGLQPHQITFKQYVEGTRAGKFEDGWLKNRLPCLDSENTRFEYERDIRYWLLPLLGDLTFAQITGDELHVQLIDKMRDENGEKLSGKRIRNVLTPFKKIWRSAVNKFGWHHLPDPVQYLVDEKLIPKIGKPRVQVFRLKEWLAVYANLDAYNRRITKFMLMTGMISSEIAGLRKGDVEFGDPESDEPGYIQVRYKKTVREQGAKLKTEYRRRDIPITKNLRELLDAAIEESPNEFVFTHADGEEFNSESLRYAWRKAFKGTGVQFRRLYALRHSLAAWSMTMGMDINKLEAIMGHGSKEMLFNRYGKYVKGLEKDKMAFLDFFGEDYL